MNRAVNHLDIANSIYNRVKTVNARLYTVYIVLNLEEQTKRILRIITVLGIILSCHCSS